MSRKLKELQKKGHPVDADVLKVLSPYRREHLNRLGDYLLDLQRPVPPLDPTIDFSFKSAAWVEMRRISFITGRPSSYTDAPPDFFAPGTVEVTTSTIASP